MESALEVHPPVSSKTEMLCPCCGTVIKVPASDCSCGARFVGKPLDSDPIKVQRLGPVMLAVSLLVLVIASSLVFTKWLALGVVLVVFSARRAVRLARENPDWYGGYRVASATLSLTVLASIAAGAFSIAYIPRYLENRDTRESAATRAEMHRVASVLEEFKRTHDSYPKNAEELKIILNESLPSDYWEKSIKYQSYTLDLASNQGTLPLGSAVIPLNYNFELKSAGPDGKDETDDDIIMRDGVFLTAAEARTQAVPRNAPAR